MKTIQHFLLLLAIFAFPASKAAACDGGSLDIHIPAQYYQNVLVVPHQYGAHDWTTGADCAFFIPAVKVEQTRTAPSYMHNADQGIHQADSTYVAGTSEGLQCITNLHSFLYNDLAAGTSAWVDYETPNSCFSAYF